MREGYDRIATNNVIVNNSLHPHVWYPNSGDVFKNNIVFAAYKPAVMNRGINPDGKWGLELDSNLFVTNSANKDKFNKNGCDLNSITGLPEFKNPDNGDYRVSENSPALQIGFKNFPMNEFGVRSKKLKEIAKTPEFPVINYSSIEHQGISYQWFGATVKNVETPGEQSAAGLPSISGVLLLEVPEYCTLANAGMEAGDVIIQIGDKQIKNFEQLKRGTDKTQKSMVLNLKIMHNQEVVGITFKPD